MFRLRSFASRSQVGFGLLLAAAACAQAEGFTSERGASGGTDGDTGGTSESGGMAGSSTTGGTGTGGTSATGGTTAKGGTTSTGGTTAKGGTTSTGGTTAKGGTTSTGGTTAKGGTTSTGKSGDVLLSDDFEDHDATDWYAGDMNGTRAVVQDDSYAYVMTTTEKAVSVGGSIDWVDQRVEAKIKFVEAANSPVIYLMARWAAEKSYLVIEVRPGTTAKPQGDMKMRQTFNGSTQDLCRFKPTSLLPGTWYKIGLSVSGGLGSTATLLFDGQPVTADAPCALKLDGPTNGGVALGVQDGSAAFDDIVVTVP